MAPRTALESPFSAEALGLVGRLDEAIQGRLDAWAGLPPRTRCGAYWGGQHIFR